MRRKLFICTLFFILGIMASYYYFFFMVITASAVFFTRRLDEFVFQQAMRKVIVCFFMAGFMVMSFSQLWELHLHDIFLKTEKCHTGIVESVKIKKGRNGSLNSELVVNVRSGRVYTQTKILVKKYNGRYEDYNLCRKKVVFKGKLERPKPNGNPRCFDYETYLKSRGIYFICAPEYIQPEVSNFNFIDRLHRYIFTKRENFIKNLRSDDETKGIIKGILFGDTAMMSEELQEDFRENGTAHVLAVSGIHVGILYSIYKRLTLRKKSSVYTAFFVIFLLCYGVATLWSVSVTRAIILILLKLLADKLDLRFDLLSSLSLTCLCMMLFNPWTVFGADFQMSFLAVTAIAFLLPFLGKWTAEEVAAAVGIQMGILPYSAYTFNKIPLIALLCNIPVIILLSVLLPVSMAAFAANLASNSFEFLGNIICSMGTLLIKLNKLLNFNGMFSADVVSPHLFSVTAVYFAMFFISSEICFVLLHRKRYTDIAKILCVAVIIVFAVFIKEQNGFDRANAVMVDVGQGDCLHIKTGDGKNVIFDGGGKAEYDVGKKILKPYFLHNGADGIDAAFVTHLHTDHYKGIQELSRCFKVNKIIYKGKKGDRYRIGKSLTVEILWPEIQDFTIEDENENSLIFKVHIDGISILITGDISRDGEAKLIEKYRGTDVLKCDVLKVPHHGSKYSSSQEFIDAVSPDLAVIGVGKNNYGHPSDEVIEKLKQKGIITYRTDNDGAIGIIKEKGNISVCRQIKSRSEVFGTLQWTIKKVYSTAQYCCLAWKNI